MKKNICKSLIVTIIILVVGCKQPKHTLTDIFNPQFNLTLKDLLNDGFEGIPEDVVLLGKYIGDTLIYYQFDDFKRKSKPTPYFVHFLFIIMIQTVLNVFFIKKNVL